MAAPQLSGDWYCGAANCGAHNFASRSSCFECAAVNNDSAADTSRSRAFGGAGTAWKSDCENTVAKGNIGIRDVQYYDLCWVPLSFTAFRRCIL
ncbi:hypothetical protein GmHk_15G042500 [Glycine max]|nr:hypothetical protein GmHk_15G042500 [Glycine max]